MAFQFGFPSASPTTIAQQSTLGNLAEHCFAKLRPRKINTQAIEKSKRQMTEFTQTPSAPYPFPNMLQFPGNIRSRSATDTHDTRVESGSKRISNETPYPNSNRKTTKTYRNILRNGKEVKIHEVLGLKISASSRYAKKCTALRCKEIWKVQKCFENHYEGHYKDHVKDFENEDGTLTCCHEVLTRDKVASHIWNQHMEGVGTFTLPKHLPSAELEDFASVSTPASNTIFDVETPRPAHTRIQRYDSAPYRRLPFNPHEPDFIASPVAFQDSTYKPMPPPQSFQSGHKRQYHAYESRESLVPRLSSSPPPHQLRPNNNLYTSTLDHTTHRSINYSSNHNTNYNSSHFVHQNNLYDWAEHGPRF